MATCEAACRDLERACAETRIDLLIDGRQIARATARLLARFADYDPTNTAMQVAVCQAVAARIAPAFDGSALGAAAYTCAASCSSVLDQIWDRAVDPSASWDDRYGPVDVDLDAETAFDADEPTVGERARRTRMRMAPIDPAS